MDHKEGRIRLSEFSLVNLQPVYCSWDCDGGREDGGYYESDCGYTFSFTDDGLEENGFKFCPFCGKPIQAVYHDGESDLHS